MKTCICPGSFDPITIGHLDIIRRASLLFDRVVVVVLHNPAKHGSFTVEERLDLIRTACSDLDHVEVAFSEGLTAACAERLGACAIVRGLRSAADWQSEQPMAQINHDIAPGVDTVFLSSAPEHAHISSSAVRELASLNGNWQAYVPESIVPALEKHFKQ